MIPRLDLVTTKLDFFREASERSEKVDRAALAEFLNELDHNLHVIADAINDLSGRANRPR